MTLRQIVTLDRAILRAAQGGESSDEERLVRAAKMSDRFHGE